MTGTPLSSRLRGGHGVADDAGDEFVELGSGEPAGGAASKFPVLEGSEWHCPLLCGLFLSESVFDTSGFEPIGKPFGFGSWLRHLEAGWILFMVDRMARIEVVRLIAHRRYSGGGHLP